MKFDAETLFEIAQEEYRKAGRIATAEGAGQWAAYSAEEEYESEEEVREELRGYIADEIKNEVTK